MHLGGDRDRLVSPAIPRNLQPHLQRAAEDRLHEPSGRLVPIGRGDGADQEQDANPRQEVWKPVIVGRCPAESRLSRAPAT
jgi:hypothetical protein